MCWQQLGPCAGAVIATPSHGATVAVDEFTPGVRHVALTAGLHESQVTRFFMSDLEEGAASGLSYARACVMCPEHNYGIQYKQGFVYIPGTSLYRIRIYRCVACIRSSKL